MAVEIGSRVTLGDGSEGVVVEKSYSLNGQHWNVRIGSGPPWASRLVREQEFTDVQPPPTREVGERVRLGQLGRPATVEEVVEVDGETQYMIRSKTTFGTPPGGWTRDEVHGPYPGRLLF